MSRNKPESQFQKLVMDYAKLRGWRTAHFRPAMNSRGQWRTAVAGDGAGFPDELMVRRDRIVVAELKAGKNKTTPEQDQWLAAFSAAGVETYVWRIEDWSQIQEVLY